jgi:predicted nucleic acid-binding protein
VSRSARVLLDTSVIIDFERVDLGEFAIAEPLISAVTVAELAYGLDTDDPIKRQARMERFYAALEQFTVLPFDTEAAKIYGTMAALVRRAGRNPRPRRMDLQIAATSSAHSMPLLTRNAKDFANLERLVEVITV